ncbi:hypothetical protein MMC16_005347 [Acarospora aff. strigata]|nr:hypothetical protein [Acarospora aff. strigata]
MELLTSKSYDPNRPGAATEEKPSLETSPPAGTFPNDFQETISIHYSPAEDPYWTEQITSNKQDVDVETAAKEDTGEWLPFMLDDPPLGRGGAHDIEADDAFAQRWPSIPSPDAITIHLEAYALLDEFRRNRMPPVFIEPPAIDTSVLRKVRGEVVDAEADQSIVVDSEEESEAESTQNNGKNSPKSARGQLLRDSEALFQFLSHQNEKHAAAADGDNNNEIPQPTASHYAWQTSLLSSLPPQPTHDPPPPSSTDVLSDPLLTDLWVRDQMRSRWTTKYQTTLTHSRAWLKSRLANAQRIRNTSEIRAVTSAKRELHRMVFTTCRDEALREINTALQSRLHAPLTEISDLSALWKAQQCLLLENQHYSAAETYAAFADRESHLQALVADIIPDIEDRLSAVTHLLAMASDEMRKMRTRYSRLCALDVADPEKRLREMQRRVNERPVEALGYLLKSWEDLRNIREVAWAVVERFEDLEGGLGGLGDAVMDVLGAAEGAVLMS